MARPGWKIRILVMLGLLFAPAMHAMESADPFFGEALFYAHQDQYFEALQRLDSEIVQHYGVDERELDSLYRHIDEAEFSVGDFELRYRMHLRAGRAIRAVLEGDVEPDVRADAAFRLARLHFQKGQPADALTVLDAMDAAVPERIRDDVGFLRANVLMALDRDTDAAVVLKGLLGSKRLDGFSAYNLGIALLEAGRTKEALAQLERAGRVKPRDREMHAIRDKSNLVLGSLLFEASQFGPAQKALERVRLEGPYSNQALLRAGWADASDEKYDRAVVPWSILAERDATDSAVQEALLALPYAYGELDVHGRAAVLYGRAVSSFGAELERLDASVLSIEKGEFLKALVREEIRQDKDWVVHLRSLPEAPETFYLIALMASHDFQTALQNYLDLADMGRKLVEWQKSLDAFEDVIRLRRSYYEPRLPDVDRAFRRLDAQIRLRLEQRKNLDHRLQKMLTSPAPGLLATSEEAELRARLERIEQRLATQSEGLGLGTQRRRLERLKGVLAWRASTQYHERLTDAHAHLRALDADVDLLNEQYDAFVRTRQAASHSYVGYDGGIDTLRSRVASALVRLEGLRIRQGVHLETVATRELLHRRERLEVYQNRARFAFADSYDRAAKAQALGR